MEKTNKQQKNQNKKEKKKVEPWRRPNVLVGFSVEVLRYKGKLAHREEIANILDGDTFL